jgi:hypothetical protein
MKKSLGLTLLYALLVFVSIAQEIKPNNNLTKESYEQKRKLNRKTGNILLGTGVGLMAGGFILAEVNSDKVDFQSFDLVGVGIVMIGAGIVSSLVSIPFYLTAHNYKIKSQAAIAKLKIETFSPIPGHYIQQPIPALSLSIPLNKRK